MDEKKNSYDLLEAMETSKNKIYQFTKTRITEATGMGKCEYNERLLENIQ